MTRTPNTVAGCIADAESLRLRLRHADAMTYTQVMRIWERIGLLLTRAAELSEQQS